MSENIATRFYVGAGKTWTALKWRS